MISLFGWNRASHHSEALGTQQVSDGLGAFPWPSWSFYDYRKGGWGVFWGLRSDFSVLLVLSLISQVILEFAVAYGVPSK